MKIYLLLFTLCFVAGTISAQEKTNVTKGKKVNQLDEVVVTAEYQPQSLKNSVYRTRVINSEKIRLRAATNIQQVLSTELGFRFSNDLTLGTSDVQLMGMSGRNVKILLDGVPMIDRSDTRESLNQIDINTVERIEIVEGPLSVSYGTDALAGVINIITKKPGKENYNINARIQEETVGSNYGPLNGDGLHIQHVGAGWQKKGFSALVGATHNDFSGFQIPSLTSTAAEIDAVGNRWKPKSQWLANTKLGYTNDKLNLWYRLDYVDEDIDTRLGYNPNNYKGVTQQYVTKRYTQQVQGSYIFSDKLLFNGSVANSNLKRSTITKEHNYATGEVTLSAGAGQQDISKFNATSVRGTAQYKLSDNISFQPGVEINLDGSSGARISGSPSINDYAFFISSELKLLTDLTVRPGLRFIHNSVYDAPPVIPSLNAKLKLTEKLDLRAGYASGFRSPALRELYYDFFDASHSIMGNPDLKAEQSNSYTASLTWANATTSAVNFRSTLSGFYNNFRNRIEFGLYSGDKSITTLINIAKYRTTGGTFENTLSAGNFEGSLGFSLVGVYNNYSESASTYGESPALVWSPELNTNLTYTFPKIGTTINLAYKYTGKKPIYEVATENTVEVLRLTRTAGFSMADLMITKKILNSLNLNAGVKNLFDLTTINNTAVATGSPHGSGGGPVPITYGRSYVLGLSFNLSKP